LKLTHSKSALVFKPLPADDPRQRKPDTALAQSTIGWQATTALAEGLKHTIAYFDELLGMTDEVSPALLQLRTA
jgi:UDP-glucuronate decarboxylase